MSDLIAPFLTEEALAVVLKTLDEIALEKLREGTFDELELIRFDPRRKSRAPVNTQARTKYARFFAALQRSQLRFSLACSDALCKRPLSIGIYRSVRIPSSNEELYAFHDGESHSVVMAVVRGEEACTSGAGNGIPCPVLHA